MSKITSDVKSASSLWGTVKDISAWSKLYVQDREGPGKTTMDALTWNVSRETFQVPVSSTADYPFDFS